ncbi:MAG: NUDIX hydrolase [Burkholderiales bacterium]
MTDESPLTAAPADSDADAHLRETCLTSRQVYRGHFLDVRADRVRLPNGAEASREYIVHPGAAVIIALLDDGRLVMERQYRYPMGRAMIEFPAGKLDAGEPSFTCAVRELREETGYVALEWAFAGTLHNAIAYADEHIDIWFARGLSLGPQRLDDEEFLDVFTATPQQLSDWVRDGTVTDAKTLIGLLWLQQWQAGHWPLSWQSA